MNHIATRLVYAGLAFGLPNTGSAQALPDRLEARDEEFQSKMTVAGTTLERCGTGVLRFNKIIPVYQAVLYVGVGNQSADVLEDVPKRIEVNYRISVAAERLCSAGEKILAQTFSADELEPVRGRLDTINRWYPDARPGDRCSITYIPGWGTELEFNGRSLGRIGGAEFARIYFSIWLGPEPASASLKKALMRKLSK